MVDFSKHKHGDVVVVHCCDECARKAGVNPTASATDRATEFESDGWGFESSTAGHRSKT